MDADPFIPEEVLLDTTPISSFLEVFARLGGLALIAEHLPQLYQETPVAQQPAKSSAQGSMGAGGSADKAGASAASSSSNWWKYGSELGMGGVKDWGEFEDYEVSAELELL